MTAAMTELKGWRLVEHINDTIRLSMMLDELGVPTTDEVSSWKTYCPLGSEHVDGGIDRALRYYGSTNSAFCFAMHGYLTPVRLVELLEHVPPIEAAKRLSERAGADTNVPYTERFRLALERARITTDRAELVRTLQQRLHGLPDYAALQLHQEVLSQMSQVLTALDDVSLDDPSSIRTWYTTSVQRVAGALDKARTST